MVSLGAEPAAAAATGADAFASSSDFMTDQPNMKWTAQKAQSERERERERDREKEGRGVGEKGQKHLAVHYLGHWLTDLPAD